MRLGFYAVAFLVCLASIGWQDSSNLVGHNHSTPNQGGANLTPGGQTTYILGSTVAVRGALQIVPGAGSTKVWTSNATGFGSWQVPASTLTITTQSFPVRTDAVIYQNTGDKPRFVAISTIHSGGIATVEVSSFTAPSNIVARGGGGTGSNNDYANHFLVVLPGYYYRLNLSGASSLVYWTEWQ